MNRIAFEKPTVEKMIMAYCRHRHNTPGLCSICMGIKEYAFNRIDNCPLMPDKPVCSACHIHCYRSSVRAEIREIMRYSGPRMIYISPIRAILYQLIKKKLLPA